MMVMSYWLDTAPMGSPERSRTTAEGRRWPSSAVA